MMISLISALKEEIVKDNGLPIEVPEWQSTAQELFEIKAVIKGLEAKEEMLKKQLVLLSDGDTRYNETFIFQRSERAGGYDYGKIFKDYQVDPKPYQKDPVVCWKLSKI